MIWTLLLIHLAICCFTSRIATNKGRTGSNIFIISLIFSPVIGGLIAAFLGKNEAKLLRNGIKAKTHQTCLSCAQIIVKQAKVCPHCRRSPSKVTAKSHSNNYLQLG